MVLFLALRGMLGKKNTQSTQYKKKKKTKNNFFIHLCVDSLFVFVAFVQVVAVATVFTMLRYAVQDRAHQYACDTGIDKPDVQRKYSESIWKVLFYTVSFGCGAALLFSSGWLDDLRLLWVNVPSEIGKPMAQ